MQKLCGMLYADIAGIVPRSSERLARMLTVTVTSCSAFWLTVSEDKTDIMRLPTKDGGEVPFAINAAGQVHKETDDFVPLGGAINAHTDLSMEITHRLRRAWAWFQRYKMEIFDRPGGCLLLKVRF